MDIIKLWINCNVQINFVDPFGGKQMVFSTISPFFKVNKLRGSTNQLRESQRDLQIL